MTCIETFGDEEKVQGDLQSLLLLFEKSRNPVEAAFVWTPGEPATSLRRSSRSG